MNKSILQPYLCFNGNCEEAMQFYKSVMGGELEINRFADYAGEQMHVAQDQMNKVMHATLQNDLLSFMASDSGPAHQVVFGDSITMSIAGEDEVKLANIFTGLSEGGKITLPLTAQVWGDKFGMLTDKYGIHWMINIAGKK